MSTSYQTVTLKRGKQESLERFHPWVFSGALANVPASVEEGDVVKVVTAEGRVVGVGHYQIGSIAVRILDFADTEIDAAFFFQILRQFHTMKIQFFSIDFYHLLTSFFTIQECHRHS